MILVALTICAFAVATTEFVLVGMLPEISGSLHVSLAVAGLLVTVYMLVVTIGGPTAAVLTRKLPRRGLLVATMAVAAVSAAASALAPTYPLLLVGRIGSALAQALFMAVASQVAMAAVAPERQTAAVARVFNGFALATVIGLPLGTLIGQAYGWRATFWTVTVLSLIGLLGVLVFCPQIDSVPSDGARTVRVLARRDVLSSLLVTLFALTGFVAAFTYVTPALRDLAGASGGQASAALVVYGLGTVVGNLLAGRVRPTRIALVLPAPLVVLTIALLTQGLLLRELGLALISVFALGVSAFVVVPLVQTRLMALAGPSAAGFIAAVNISVAGLAGALGAGLGSVVLSSGLGLAWIGPVASPIVAVGVVIAIVSGVHARAEASAGSGGQHDLGAPAGRERRSAAVEEVGGTECDPRRAPQNVPDCA